MKDKRFMEACDRLNIRDSRREELLGEIFLRIEAEEREGKYMKDSNRRRRQGKLWPKLAPVLAVVLILGAILLVPSVGEAVSGWFGRLFDRSEYLGTMPEKRASMPDVEAAIQSPKDTEQDYTIYTLDETDEAVEFAAARANYGFAPYNPEDWQWLKEAEPKITDILVENGKLTVISYLDTDPLPFWYEDENMKLDWYGDELYLTNGSKTYELYFGSTGLQPQEGYFNGEEMNIDRVKQDKGVMLYTEYNIALDNIPEGHYDAVFTSRILDCRVDVMANFATIAKIEQRFEVDIDDSNTLKRETGNSVRLDGQHMITVDEQKDRTYKIYNTTVDMSKVVITPEITYNATSIVVKLHFGFEGNMTEAEKISLLSGYRKRGFGFDLIVDGESVKDLSDSYMSIDSNEHDRYIGLIEIPLSVQQQKDAKSIVLRPKLFYMTSLVVKGNIPVDLTREPFEIEMNEEGRIDFNFDNRNYEESTFENCDIVIK